MSNFGSHVDGFTVNKTTQEICNSQNRNETNMIITFTIEHDKLILTAIVLHSNHDLKKFNEDYNMY